MQTHTNRLVHETSPYLKQHAHNPVDWYPWGEEAFRIAEAENKPVLLSIGYAACHWCHVMEEESFENDAIAAIMNEGFVNIKVDREERPDIDQIYMRYVQLITGSGGWPMTVFLTPEKQPFYGGTYFPPEDRSGRPGFKRLLGLIKDYYHNKQENLHEGIQKLNAAFDDNEDALLTPGAFNQTLFDDAVKTLSGYYEPKFGGLGNAPKFPAVQALSLFLRKYDKGGDKTYLNMVTHTLKNMGRGGIFDQIGGGFARYSVDNEWLVPHFEKMLYDNAQLVNLYLDAYLITGEMFYLEIVQQTLNFVIREMISNEGGFYSSLDADSEGEEGKFYVWEKSEITELLDKETGELFAEVYNISAKGNFEGKNILNLKKSWEELARQHSLTENELSSKMKLSRDKLLTAREERVRPGLDDKVIVSWNGLMLSAFARLYQVTRNPEYEKVINSNVKFLRNSLWVDSKLLHTYHSGTAKIDAFLDDYANLIQGLLDAYEALFDQSYLQWAIQLTEQVNQYFWDENHAGYFFTSAKQEKLLKRMKDDYDQSVPSGSGIMCLNQLRLYALTAESSYLDKVEKIFRHYSHQMKSNPYGYASYLNALDFYVNKPAEILIINGETKSSQMLETIFDHYMPNRVIVKIEEESQRDFFSKSLVSGRDAVGGKTTAYVCRNFVCSLPVTDHASLKELLKN